MYVPPSRRAGQTAPPASHLPPDYRRPVSGHNNNAEVYDPDTISHHFTHPLAASITYFSYPLPLDTPRALELSVAESAYRTSTHPQKDVISYIAIFSNAHPDWKSKSELWVHNRAEFLMDDYGTDEAPGRRLNFGRPIPIFDGSEARRDQLEFAGYYQIDSLRVVAPGSDELLEIHERKVAAHGYSAKGRSPEEWALSFGRQWLKLRLSKSPSSSIHYTTLENPMRLRSGAEGEVGQYLLKIGGLEDESAI